MLPLAGHSHTTSTITTMPNTNIPILPPMPNMFSSPRKSTPGSIPAAVPSRKPCNCKNSRCLKLSDQPTNNNKPDTLTIIKNNTLCVAYMPTHSPLLFVVVLPVVCACVSYCECFASGFMCSPNCHCRGCLNNPSNETTRNDAIETTLEKNPLAFKPKIASSPISKGGGGGRTRTPAASPAKATNAAGGSTQWNTANAAAQPEDEGLQIRQVHHKGCHCKKSHCLKK